MSNITRLAIVGGAAILTIVGAACGEAADANEATAPTTPATAEIIVTPDPAETTAGLMPDVVCLDLQTAQDTIQAETELFFSDSNDATGRGREQLLDSNWLVVGQSPAAGDELATDDIPMLDVVKFGEAPC